MASEFSEFSEQFKDVFDCSQNLKRVTQAVPRESAITSRLSGELKNLLWSSEPTGPGRGAPLDMGRQDPSVGGGAVVPALLHLADGCSPEGSSCWGYPKGWFHSGRILNAPPSGIACGGTSGVGGRCPWSCSIDRCSRSPVIMLGGGRPIWCPAANCTLQ